MPADDRPNILIIMTDQQRGDCLSIDGHPCLLTPNMDVIGGQGTRFTRGYTTCPSCIPARRSLMTGQFPATNGMVGYAEGYEMDDPPTLPGELRKAGYQTGMIGRNMHMWPPRKRYGFDHLIVQDGRGGVRDEYQADLEQYTAAQHGGLHRNGIVRAHGISGNGWTARPWHLDEAVHPTTWTVTKTIEWLERRDTTCPFFAVSSFIAPHPPLIPPAFYLDRYLRLDLPEPAIGDWAEEPPNDGLGRQVDSDWVKLTGEALRSARAGYYGLINHVDDQLRRLHEATPPNTVVVFTSDHGEMLGDHYLFRKCYPYEGSARVPFMIRGTGSMGLSAGNVCDRPVCLEDIMPTCLELAGVDVPETVDGQSLVPFLAGQSDAPWRDYLHGEHATCYRREQANHYLTDGHEKYVWMTERGDEQLFNLDDDPRELTNLAAKPEHAQRAATWRDRLIERIKDRPEGFTDGKKLIAGREYVAALPHAGPRQ